MQFISNGTWKGNLGLGLAERELSCLMSIACGMTDKEIAQRDGLSPRSIKGRIESAMFKLGVYKRPALVAEAMRRGFISPVAISLVALVASRSGLGDNPAMINCSSPGKHRVEQRSAGCRFDDAQLAA